MTELNFLSGCSVQGSHFSCLVCIYGGLAQYFFIDWFLNCCKMAIGYMVSAIGALNVKDFASWLACYRYGNIDPAKFKSSSLLCLLGYIFLDI
ncbi:hypothetical protein [Nitrosomonas communis]|uniref:hypothetical protein n=1 Tax=Nitrosomonas communis TaxID=44574 RepID=UPI0026EF0B42|nr:hypothetical protein [Nitrosomonas communis]MCO6426792.1 hypothetical protein [Nitrosomonas communis]